jgi:hypothetical protein
MAMSWLDLAALAAGLATAMTVVNRGGTLMTDRPGVSAPCMRAPDPRYRPRGGGPGEDDTSCPST